jgi:hypothetical protein
VKEEQTMRGQLVFVAAALAASIGGGALADQRYETATLHSVKTTDDVRGCLMGTLSSRTQPIETPLASGGAWRIAFTQDRDQLALKVEKTPQRGSKITYPRRLGPDQTVYNKVRGCT